MVIAVPSIATLVLAGLPWASHNACASEAPERTLPASAWVAARRACPSRDAKRGTANAARMPRIVITTTSSIRVKPPCSTFLFTAAILRKLKRDEALKRSRAETLRNDARHGRDRGHMWRAATVTTLSGSQRLRKSRPASVRPVVRVQRLELQAVETVPGGVEHAVA